MNGLNYWAQTGQAPLGRWPIWDFEMFVLSRLKATEITIKIDVTCFAKSLFWEFLFNF